MSVSSSLYQQQFSPVIAHQPSPYEYLNEIVSKRVTTITYLCHAHEGTTHWFNTILLSKEDLANMYPNFKMQRRTCHFYMLGASLGNILEFTDTLDYVKALNQLLNEYEYYTNDHAKQKMKNIFRKARGKDDGGYVESGEFTYLIVQHMPFELDYLETFYTLCELIVEAYKKLLVDSEGCTQGFLDMVLKCDSKFKKIIALVSKELDALARNAIKEELKSFYPLLQSSKYVPFDFE